MRLLRWNRRRNMTNIIDLAYAGRTLKYLIPYIPVTLSLAIVSMVAGCILGLAVMVVRWKKIPVLSQLGTVYVVVGRAVPTLIILYVVFFAFPVFLMVMNHGIIPQEFNSIQALFFAMVGLSLHAGAYLAEIFRAAVNSVPKGQMEAALSIGMTWPQAFCRIVLPQAAVMALPLMGNQFLGLIKGSSIAFMITVMELFGAANYLSGISERYIEIYLALALLYWGISLFFEGVFHKAETHLAVYKGSKA